MFLVALLFAPAPPFAAGQADPEQDAAAIRKLLADASGVGLPIGAAAPAFKLKDQDGRERDLGSLTGPRGLVLVFFRSADW